MADNVDFQSSTLATPAANTKISTDEDATNGHVQRVKLAISADGSSTHVPATEADGILVNLGGNNDVTLATLPDTAAGDLAAITAASQNTISTDNSTTTPLAGDAAYTGTWEDVSTYSAVTINIYASHDSATSGMQFQFSSDGSNADDVYSFTLDASQSNNRRFQYPVTSRYFRVVYTNGSTLQTAFRVQTILHQRNVLTSIHRVDDTVTTDRSATLVKAIMAGKIAEGSQYVVGTSGEYENMSITTWRELRTRDQRQVDLANCNDYTVFTTLGDDTANLADSVNHVFGTGSITFDKVNGTANTVYAGVQDTITSIDSSERFEAGSFVALGVYLPSVSNVVAVFLRVGTDSSNYNMWEWPVDELSSGQWLSLRAPTNQPNGYAGNGWNPAAITYVAFGVEFSAETNTLAGIIFDNVHMVGGRITDSTIDASITSAVNTPNINLHRVGGTPTDTNTGNSSAGTQRVVLASDQPAVTVDGSGVTQPISADALPLPSGAATAANQSTANSTLSAIQTAVEGDVTVDGRHHVSTANASTTPLAGDATYTGTGELIAPYSVSHVSVVTDQDSATNGLSIQYSQDNTNWDVAETHTVTGGKAEQVVTPHNGLYMRVVYTNGSTLQTYFRLQVMHHSIPIGNKIERLDGDIQDDHMAQTVKAVLAAMIPAGTYTNIGATTSGNLKVSVQELSDGTDVGAGNIGSETQRVTIATDDANLAAILADTANMDTNLGTLASAGLLTTAAHDAAFGTAGSADAQVRTIQGVAGMTAVVVDGSGVTQPVSGTVTANLSATDNQVLDNIDAQTAGAETALELIDGAIIGPGEPTIDSYTQAAINLTAGADQVLVASAPSKQVWVYGIGFTLSAAGTVSFQDEDDTAVTGVMPFAANSGMALPPSGNFSMPMWKLGTDKDLEVDLVTADMDGWIAYAIVSV